LRWFWPKSALIFVDLFAAYTVSEGSVCTWWLNLSRSSGFDFWWWIFFGGWTSSFWLLLLQFSLWNKHPKLNASRQHQTEYKWKWLLGNRRNVIQIWDASDVTCTEEQNEGSNGGAWFSFIRALPKSWELRRGHRCEIIIKTMPHKKLNTFVRFFDRYDDWSSKYLITGEGFKHMFKDIWTSL
jgi:hypothetical protein